MTQFEQLVDRLDGYIWYSAHRMFRPASGIDVQDLHQLGLIKLYQMSLKYQDKPAAEFDLLFKQSVFNMHIDTYNKYCVREELRLSVDLDLDEIEEDIEDSNPSFAEVYLREYQQHMESMLSEDAAVLLEHLLFPTPAVYHMHNIQRMRREALQSQGIAARVPTKLTQALVGQVIGFSASKTKALIREIREVWMTQCRMPSYRRSVAMS